MRIWMVTQFFDPEPTPRGLAFARGLQMQGHEVEVITGFPNYPGGKVYAGYRIRLYQQELVHGVRIHRLPLFPSHSQSRVGRVLNYVSFGASALFFCLFRRPRPDVIFAYHPPLTVGIAVGLVQWMRRIPFVLDIQDLWPDTLRATGMIGSSRLIDLVGWVCGQVYRRAAAISVISDGFRRRLLDRGVPAEKLEVVHNWCDEASTPLPAGHGTELDTVMAGRFNVVFAGNMGRAQALDSVLDAARVVQLTRPAVQFVFVGRGIELAGLKKRVVDEGIGNVVFLPQMPMSTIGAVYARAQVLLVHLRADPLFEITIPSKTQAYLRAGKPVLMAVAGDAAGLVTQAGSGWCVPPENARALAEAVVACADTPADELDAMGRRARAYYDAQLSMRRGITAFETIFRRIIRAS